MIISGTCICIPLTRPWIPMSSALGTMWVRTTTLSTATTTPPTAMERTCLPIRPDVCKTAPCERVCGCGCCDVCLLLCWWLLCVSSLLGCDVSVCLPFKQSETVWTLRVWVAMARLLELWCLSSRLELTQVLWDCCLFLFLPFHCFQFVIS